MPLTFKSTKYVAIIGLAISAIAFAFLRSAEAFLSVEGLLKTGYYMDSEYPQRIRGVSCGGCDDGVLQFKHSIALIDIMSDEQSRYRNEADFAFTYLQRHLLRQFDAFESEETTQYALDMLRHLLAKDPGNKVLSVVYYQLHKTPDEELNRFEVKRDKVIEARSLFHDFCSQVWGEDLMVEKTSDGDLYLESDSHPIRTATKAEWTLHTNTITRRAQGGREVLPRSCFKSQKSVYQLLDYDRSFELALYVGNRPLATEMVNVKPELLEGLRKDPDRFGSVVRMRLAPNSKGADLTSYRLVAEWLTKEDTFGRGHKTNLLKNPAFEEGSAHWSFSSNSHWESTIGNVQTAGVKMETEGNRHSHISQCIPLDGHQSYKLSAYVKIEGNTDFTNSNYAYLSWHDEPDCKDSGQGGGQLPAKPGDYWRYIEGLPWEPTMDAVAARASLVQSASGNTAYWDNIKLHAVGAKSVASPANSSDSLKTLPPNHNLIQNSSFSDGLEGWHNRSTGSWRKHNGQYQSFSHSTHSPAKRMLRTEVATDSLHYGGEMLSQCLLLGKQRRYRLSAYLQREAESDQEGGASILVVWYADSGCTGQRKTAYPLMQIRDASKWYRRDVLLEAPRGATSVLILLRQHVNGPGRFVLKWDNVELRTAERKVEKTQLESALDEMFNMSKPPPPSESSQGLGLLGTIRASLGFPIHFYWLTSSSNG